MSGLTITTLAQQVQDLLDKNRQQNSYLAAWLGGSADGGPNNDGRYPFVDLSGRETLVPSPASFNDMTSGPAAQASVAKVAAELARDLAKGHADRSDAQRVLSEAARGAAVDARNLAQEHRNHAGTHEANARYWAELAQGSGQSSSEDREIVEQLAAETADNAALAAQDAEDAAASAALAATFDPGLYDKKSETLAASRLTGMIDPGRIPVLVGQTPLVSTGGISDLSGAQQAEIRPGTLVATTDGRRWVYSGTGSRDSEASYIEQGDVTPVWSVIANKPPFFPSNIVNVFGLQSALNDKSNTGHGHSIADVSGLQAALDGRSLNGHVHAWTTITDRPTIFPSDLANVSGLQAALDGKSATGHVHAWDTITGKPSTFAASAHSHPISEITNLQATLNDKLSLSAGANTLAGALYVTNRLNVNGADPYLGSEGPTRSLVIAGGGGWTSTGSTIVTYGVNHPSGAGNVLISAGETGVRNLTFTGFASAQFNVRPTFAGNTAWDTGNFNPATKADANSWNSQSVSYVLTGVTKSFGSGVANGDIASQAGVAALEVRTGTDSSPGAAFLQFHRPGAYATNLGLDKDNRLKIGGWSYGATSDHIWHSSNIPNDKWQTSVDGQNRFYFATDGRTYFGAYNNQGWTFRNNANGADAFTVSVAGAATFASTVVAQGGYYTNGNEVSIRGTSPTIFLRDTDNRSGMIHMNSNTMHFLRGAGNDTSAWETVNGRWPLTLNMDSNDATFGGSVDVRTHLYAGNNVYASGEVYAGNWFRVQAACGIYWEQYGGGWHMSDSTYLRVYNNKYLYSAGAAGFDGNVNMGSFAVLSDARLKTHIRPLTGYGELIDRLSVKTYLKGGKPEWGVIAQEVETVEPMLVVRAGDPTGEWGDEPLRTVDANSLMFAMLAEVKDLRGRVANLEGRQ